MSLSTVTSEASISKSRKASFFLMPTSSSAALTSVLANSSRLSVITFLVKPCRVARIFLHLNPEGVTEKTVSSQSQGDLHHIETCCIDIESTFVSER